MWVDKPGEDPEDFMWLKEQLQDNLCSVRDLAKEVMQKKTLISYFRRMGVIYPVYQKGKHALYWMPEATRDIYSYIATSDRERRQDLRLIIKYNLDSDW